MRNFTLLPFLFSFLILVGINSTAFAQTNFEKDAGTLINEYLQKSTHTNKTLQFHINDDMQDEASGIRHIYAQQQVNGIFVKDALLSLHFSKTFGAVSPADQFVQPLVNAAQPIITSEKAVLDVMASLGLSANDKLTIRESSSGLDQQMLFDKGSFAAENIKARLMYHNSYKKGQPLRLAWETQFYTRDRQHFWLTYTDATDGTVLEKQDLVLKCHFGGEETDGSPAELAQMEKEHQALHEAAAARIEAYLKEQENRKLDRINVPLAKPSLFAPSAALAAPANTYLVLNHPAEAPNDNTATNTQTNVTTAGDPTASPYGWTSDDGVTEYTYTRGNNVWAFQDPSPGPLGGAPNPAPNYSTPASNTPPTAPFTYNYPWDLTQEPEYSTNNTANMFPNRNAANVNLFYWNNLMHDVFYPFGFTEKGRNFQTANIFTGNNKGGVGNDGVLAQSQDGGGTNNANFLTLADGTPGQMQMYLWTAAVLDNLVQIGTVVGGTPPPSNGTQYPSIQGAIYLAANESNPALNLDLFARPVLNKDFIVVQKNMAASAGTSSQGCGAGMGVGLAPSNVVTGKIVLIDRGTCSFVEKVHGAQLGGAAGVIVMNNDMAAPNAVLAMGGSDATINSITIPAVMVSYNKGLELKAALASGAIITGSLKRDNPKIPKKDGDFDNGIIAHEYGHGISSRTSPQTASGGSLSGNEQGGEGWSDFWALYMTTRTNDLGAATTAHPNGVLPDRGIGSYVTYAPISGGGIRPRKYSINTSTNEFVFAGTTGGIADPTLTVPHGIGFVWCTMLYEIFQEMIDQYPFNDNIYYSPNNVAGLAGAGGNNVANKLILEGIRLQPASPTFIQQRDGILKADTLFYGGIHSCRLWRAFAKRGLGFDATDATNALGNETNGFQLPPACDPGSLAYTIEATAPDTLKNGTALLYTIKVTNIGAGNISVNISSPIPTNTAFQSASDGGAVSGSNVVWTGVSVSAGQTVTRTTLLSVTTPTTSTLYFYDNQESGASKWTTSATNPLYPWGQTTSSAYTGTTSWFATDPDGITDAALTTAAPVVLPNVNGVKLYFNHRYATELTYDGGTVETATSAVGPWTTVPLSNFEANGYPSNANVPAANNPLMATSGNNGSCFGGSSGNYIQSIVNLDALKNTSRYFRFRLTSDFLSGVFGWNVDNVYVVANPVFVNNTVSVTSGSVTKTAQVSTLITANTTALSVNLTTLSAKAQSDKTIALNWATATETNNKGFHVERRDEGQKAFTPITFVESKGNNGADYKLIDKDVEAGKLYYYRLRQEDFDGKQTVSNVVSARLDGKTISMTFNNPVNNLLNLNLTNVTDKGSNIRIFGADGRLVYTAGVSANEAQTMGINVSNWAKGFYIIQLNSGGTVIAHKLSVQ